MKIAVLAGHREQFEHWLADTGRTDSEAFYAYTPERILAEKFGEVVVVGTFWNRADAYELHRIAKSRVVA